MKSITDQENTRKEIVLSQSSRATGNKATGRRRTTPELRLVITSQDHTYSGSIAQVIKKTVRWRLKKTREKRCGYRTKTTVGQRVS